MINNQVSIEIIDRHPGPNTVDVTSVYVPALHVVICPKCDHAHELPINYQSSLPGLVLATINKCQQCNVGLRVVDYQEYKMSAHYLTNKGEGK